MLTRRQFLARGAVAGAGLYLVASTGKVRFVQAAGPDTQAPQAVPKWLTPLLVPPVMPQAPSRAAGGQHVDLYEISMRQLTQQILPVGWPATTVWGYGAVRSADPRGLTIHHAPSLTIEATWRRPVRIRWINDLVDDEGDFLPHLLPVDPSLHWANPPGGVLGRDQRPMLDETPASYRGPVPMITHVHGAVGVADDSDGYPEAWFLPDARNIPVDYATTGTWYDFFRRKAERRYGEMWGPGHVTFEYPNTNRASTLWYHDHSLGITRLNVYAGPAGFYLVRGGPDDIVLDRRTRGRAVLPGPAPAAGDPFPSGRPYFEIPIVIQDRTFNADGSLYYPPSRDEFDGIIGPYAPDGPMDEPGAPAPMPPMDGATGFPPIWNPEFFGNTMMVNGNTWPYLDVQQRRYRLRFLNGCDSRFLILDFSAIPGIEVWQIGSEGGFLRAPVDMTAQASGRVLLGLAERADLIVDFSRVPIGEHVLRNVGPDEPFGGGEPGVDFEPADPETTGQVLQFRVQAAREADPSTPPRFLVLPRIEATPRATFTRPLAMLEAAAVGVDADDHNVEGPIAALLGHVEAGVPRADMWGAPITENPGVGSTEIWEFHNTTMDAHPMHMHETVFEVVERQSLALTDEGEVAIPLQPVGEPRPAEPWEDGFKDTVTAYPGEVTRVKATFRTAGQFNWHCHIVSHEDNEMMRPYRVGPEQKGQPRGGA